MEEALTHTAAGEVELGRRASTATVSSHVVSGEVELGRRGSTATLASRSSGLGLGRGSDELPALPGEASRWLRVRCSSGEECVDRTAVSPELATLARLSAAGMLSSEGVRRLDGLVERARKGSSLYHVPATPPRQQPTRLADARKGQASRPGFQEGGLEGGRASGQGPSSGAGAARKGALKRVAAGAAAVERLSERVDKASEGADAATKQAVAEIVRTGALASTAVVEKAVRGTGARKAVTGGRRVKAVASRAAKDARPFVDGACAPVGREREQAVADTEHVAELASRPARHALKSAAAKAASRAEAAAARSVGTAVRSGVAAAGAALKSVAAKVALVLAPALPLLLTGGLVAVLLVTLPSFIGGTSSSTGSLTGVEAQVASYLKALDFTDEAIAGVLGNLYGESSMNPATDEDDGRGNISLGLFQFMGQERLEYLNWCVAQGTDWRSVENQLAWVFQDDLVGTEGMGERTFKQRWGFYDGYESDYEPCSADEFSMLDDVGRATYVWMACYEKPSTEAGNASLRKRTDAAQGYLAKLQNGSLGSGGGEDYASASETQRRIADVAKREGPAGSGLCAMWVSRVYSRAGLGYPSGNANNMYWNWCSSSDRGELKVGMIVAVDTHPHSAAGSEYGHVGIYIGDGLVMSNISGNGGAGVVYTQSLDDFVNWYGATHTVKWGYACDPSLIK